jgi:hypothetical protein
VMVQVAPIPLPMSRDTLTNDRRGISIMTQVNSKMMSHCRLQFRIINQHHTVMGLHLFWNLLEPMLQTHVFLLYPKETNLIQIAIHKFQQRQQTHRTAEDVRRILGHGILERRSGRARLRGSEWLDMRQLAN